MVMPPLSFKKNPNQSHTAGPMTKKKCLGKSPEKILYLVFVSENMLEDICYHCF